MRICWTTYETTDYEDLTKDKRKDDNEETGEEVKEETGECKLVARGI